jgi:signal transduction histidine kinase
MRKRPSTRQQVTRLKRELEAARRISRALSRHYQVDELVQQALRTALDVVGAEAGSVLLYQPDSKHLIFRHVIGKKARQLTGLSIPCDQGIAGAVFTSGRPHVTGDVARTRRHLRRVDASTGYRTRDMITLPLKRWEGAPIGVLEVLNKRRGKLGRQDLDILMIISALAAAAIEQARLFEEAKLAEVVRLLGDIGHDVGTLLAPVTCGLGMMTNQLDEFFAGLARDEAERAQPTRELCQQVISLLRDNSRRIQDRMKEIADCVKGLSAPPQFSLCRVAQVVGKVLETLRVLADEKGIQLRTEGLDLLPSMMADERRLYTAFYNLVNNAIPEVPSGGTITVSGRQDRASKSVVLAVADTGRGMPPEVRNSLFTARAISRKPGGTGLGTKIVKDVVDAHGGEITVESKEGVGTIFTMRLPIEPPPRRNAAPGQQALKG